VATPLSSGESNLSKQTSDDGPSAADDGPSEADGRSETQGRSGGDGPSGASGLDGAAPTRPRTAAKAPKTGSDPEASTGPQNRSRAGSADGGAPPPLAERLNFGSEQLIDLPTLLDDLVREGFISQRQAEDILIAPRTKKELSQHPKEIVADRSWTWRP
jgi:hypothetical protein